MRAAWGIAVAVACTGAVDRAGNARLLRMEACGRDAGAAGGSLVNHRMRGKTRHVLVLLRGPQQLREAGKENEATAKSPRPTPRGDSRKMPGRSGSCRTHSAHLWNDS